MTNLQNKNLINGRWIDSTSSEAITVTNPATGQVIAAVPAATSQQVQEAIRSSASAFTSWREATAPYRSEILLSISNIITSKDEEFAQLITLEQGKPLTESRAEVAYSASYLRWFSGEAVRIQGDIVPADSPTKRILVLKQPIGVAAAITPWNFPLAMIARKMGAALAAGCTFISKPAPETPLTALKLGEVCIEAGVPPGVVSIVNGAPEMIGGELMRSPLVRKVSFTGSTEVGKLLIRQSAGTVKKLTLELGGNAPMIICEDADLPKAVEAAIRGKYRNAGQTCICVNRFLVHQDVATRFTELLVARSKELTVGEGVSPNTQIGPLINDEAATKVSRLISSAKSEGATIALAPSVHPGGSRFISPTVITGVTPTMTIWREEIFGPISSITTFANDAEAIALANDTTYGLAAYIFSANLARAMKMSEKIDFGMVGINDSAISAVQGPFGGVKESGYGREGSIYGVDEYLTLKYLSVEL
jgi:succinate-semialdehyde dehydrogenase/glutarate-semialdehyde dehydrogenase